MARELTALIEGRGKPQLIVSDNGTEFTSNAILRWSREHQIEWHYIAQAHQIIRRSGSIRVVDVRRSRTRPSQSLISIQTGSQLLRPHAAAEAFSPILTASNLFTGAFRFWQLAFLTRRYHVRTCMRRALWYRNLWFH